MAHAVRSLHRAPSVDAAANRSLHRPRDRPTDDPSQPNQTRCPRRLRNRPVGSRRRFVVLGAALAMVVSGGAAVWALSSNSGDDSLASSDATTSAEAAPATAVEPTTEPAPSTTAECRTGEEQGLYEDREVCLAGRWTPLPKEEPTTTTEETNVVEQPIDAEPFRYSFPTIDDLPLLPTAVAGHVPYDGEDSSGQSGLVRSGDGPRLRGHSRLHAGSRVLWPDEWVR